MAYTTTKEVLKYLGKDAYTSVRNETLGTGNGTTSTWTASNNNIIDGTFTLYTNGGSVPTANYSLDLDEGVITYTANNGVVLTCDYDYSDVPDSLVSSLISSSDALIEERTGRKFTHETGCVEYLSVEKGQKVFFLKNYPVITISSVEQNTSSFVTDTPSWSTSTAGLGNDYIANDEDLRIGRIRFIDNAPLEGEDRLKVTYDYGYTTPPALVQELSKLLTIRQLANSSVYKSIFKGYDNFTPVRLEEIENRIEELFRLLAKQEISKI